MPFSQCPCHGMMAYSIRLSVVNWMIEDVFDTSLVLETVSDIVEPDSPRWCCGTLLALRFGLGEVLSGALDRRRRKRINASSFYNATYRQLLSLP